MTQARNVGPRITPVSDPTSDVAELLAKTKVGPSGRPLNLFATLARHPQLMSRFMVFARAFLAHGTLPARERELVILRTSHRTRCQYVWDQHLRIAQRAGVAADLIKLASEDGLRQAPVTDEALLLQFVDEILGAGAVDTYIWQRQRERWSDAQLIELILLPGFYRMTAAFLNGLNVQADE